MRCKRKKCRRGSTKINFKRFVQQWDGVYIVYSMFQDENCSGFNAQTRWVWQISPSQCDKKNTVPMPKIIKSRFVVNDNNHCKPVRIVDTYLLPVSQ